MRNVTYFGDRRGGGGGCPFRFSFVKILGKVSITRLAPLPGIASEGISPDLCAAHSYTTLSIYEKEGKKGLLILFFLLLLVSPKFEKNMLSLSVFPLAVALPWAFLSDCQSWFFDHSILFL